jgi:hypothetical protein
MTPIEKAPRLFGWVLFVVGCAILMVVDYALRIRTGDIRMGGVPQTLWFGFPLLLGATSLIFIWKGAKKWKHRWVGVVEVIAHFSLGILLYLAAGLYYVLGIGIDTL